MNLFSFTIYLLGILLLQACGSGLTLPPEGDQIPAVKARTTVDPDWDSNQKQAFAYLKGSCSELEALIEDKTFPLPFLAVAKSFEVCDYSPEVLEEKWNQLKVIPFWASENFYQRMEVVARKKNLKKMQAQFLVEMSKPLRIRKEKIELVQRAIHLDPDNQIYRDRLVRLAPRFSPVVNSSNIYAVARDFEKAREFTKARKLYREIINGNYDFKLQEKAFNRYRKSFKVERKLDEFILQTEAMVKYIAEKRQSNPEDDELKKAYTTAMIQWARAIWTDHRRGEAREKLLRLINSKLEDPENEALIYWLLGVMDIEAKNLKRALTHFLSADNFDIEDENLKEKIRWSVGWTEFLQKDYLVAGQFFDSAYHKYENGGFRNKLHFWAGEAYSRAGETSKANNIWEELIETDRYGYYGILAHMRLERGLPPLDAGDSSYYPELPELEWLLALNERDLAHAYLKNLQKKLKRPKQILEHLPLFKKAGYYEGGIKNFFRLKGEDRERAMRTHLYSAFPRPYRDSVAMAAERFKISPYLIYSISRQESAFNPVIRSWADAFGVMQMTPERAVVLSKRYKIPYRKVEDLFEPQTNILLGTSLLRELKNKFQNKFIGTVAGYNASDKAVQVWYRDRYKGDPIEFIEMIPYKETQDYVKLVFRNFVTYKRLESEDDLYLGPTIFERF